MIKKETTPKDNFDIIFFEIDDECPVQDFLDSLDDKMAAKVYGLMDVLAEHGNELRGPYSKHLDDGIFELRAKVGSDITRTLYFFYFGKKIIMTNGYVKKTQKTPKSVIEIAKKYRKMFLEEERNENV